jgi:hypothetical protein
MSYSRVFRISIAAAGLLALSNAAHGASTYTDTRGFAPTGLATSETAQINVANVAGASSSGTAASCMGTISFLDASGNTIGTATSFTVTSGQIFSASLPHSSTGASGRIVIRAVVQLTESSSSSAPCALSSSLEIFDSGTGVTHAVITAGGPGAGGPPGFGR